MLSKNRKTLSVLLAILILGCYDTDTGTKEVCNHLDDNWDGYIDETFCDALGRYNSIKHCGDCSINCEQLFASAEDVACELAGGDYSCIIVSCSKGTHLVGTSLCAPDGDVLCLPCVNDQDCAMADPSATCVPMPGGDTRCAPSCGESDPCPKGFDCLELETGPRCLPTSGHCGCTPKDEGLTFGCWISSPGGDYACHGNQTCEGEALTECEALQQEVCDKADNDCDGVTDEDFLVEGLYLTEEHCGACNHPCAPLAAHIEASCVVKGSTAECVRECSPGFVDLDGTFLNGCECMLADAEWPPIALGGDMNCDGEFDDTNDFIFVSKSGNNSNPGTLEAPASTIGRGIALAQPNGKTVLVAQGNYDEKVVLVESVSVFGGYRTDFGARDIDLFEAIVEHSSGRAGHPVLAAEGIHLETEIGGLVLVGSGALASGASSTAVMLNNCGHRLEIHDVKVIAGQGQNGRDARSSADILDEDFGGISLSQLDGIQGKAGQAGFSALTNNCVGLLGAGGAAGEKVCPWTNINVSGGKGGDASCPNTGCVIGEPCANAGCTDFMVDGTCDFDAVYASAVPNPPAQDGKGNGGGAAGELTYDAPTTRLGSNFCDNNPTLRREGGIGKSGQQGADGGGGLGCANADELFDIETGLWPSGNGTDGENGTDGAGGGGGTQGNGYDMLQGAMQQYTDQLGGAGGGGGSGGCGAPRAEGGGGGGGSIGVAIMLPLDGRGPSIHHVRVVPARAGDGGSGGIGAAGGASGPGGQGGDGNFWCSSKGGKGGDGGKGGAGGGGGGGCGGSISGFHVVPKALGEVGDYLWSLSQSNEVDALPAPGSSGKGGFAPGYKGASGKKGTAKAFRLYKTN